jgi:alternate signal-mediated exported protein
MHNKKIIGTVAAIGLSVTLIGGTLAWFTSEDRVTNIFATGGVNNPDNANGNGVEIWEKFIPEKNLVPGDNVEKLVQTQNTTTYDSFIRVKITPKWDPATVGETTLDTNMIELAFGDNNSNLGESDGKWLKGNDGYYYYMGKVAGGKFTNALLSDVTLSKNAGPEYRNAQYHVLVEAESIQADNDAHNDAWKGAGNTVTARLDALESTNAGGNEAALSGATITNSDTRQ